MSVQSPVNLIAVGTDLTAAIVLAAPLYYRRHRRSDLMFAFLTLNVGVLAVATVLGSAEAGVGLGLGLFGVLSIIRLRSDPISQAEVAYYFAALALGLIGGLAVSTWWVPVLFSAVLLVVVAIADSPTVTRRSQHRAITLDIAFLDEDDLRAHLELALRAEVTRLDVREVDLVRDMTMLEVWFRPLSDSTIADSAPEEARRALVTS